MNQDTNSRIADQDPDEAPAPFTLEFPPTPRITSITYGRTRQVRQYEPERVEVTIDVPNGADPHTAHQIGRIFVEEALGLRERTWQPTPAPPKAADGSEDDIPF